MTKTQDEHYCIKIATKILSNVSNPGIVCDCKGQIIFTNASYQSLLNQIIIQGFYWEHFPVSHVMPDYFKRAIKNQTETQGEITYQDNSFKIHVTPVNDIKTQEGFYIVLFEDISAKLKLNNQSNTNKQSLQSAFLNSILALSAFVESRDVFTAGHQKRVAMLSMNIAKRAHIVDPHVISTIYYGALMHDIGKISIPMEYLVTPRRLTEHEFEIIKTHVTTGNKIIEHMDFPWDIKSVVYQHHERLDGSGYPLGLKGDEITIPSKIVAIADVYDAMSSDRPYRSGMSLQVILDYLNENKGKLFEAQYIDSFFQCISELDDVYQSDPDFRPFDIN